MTDTQRTPTPIDQIAEAWVDTSAELSPGLATYIGRFEHNHRLDDLSPAGRAARLAAATSALASLREAEPVDDVDLVTKADLSGDLELESVTPVTCGVMLTFNVTERKEHNNER